MALRANAQTYNCTWTTAKDITASMASTSYLAKNASRRCLILENKDSSVNVYVRIGSAHIGTEGVVLRANSRWESIIPAIGAVYFKAASATAVVSVIEGQ